MLVRLEYPEWTGWVLPGGGKDEGEDDATALKRELVEETGLPEVFLGPPLWSRRWYRDRSEGSKKRRWDGQEETVYLIPCHPFEIAPTMTVAELLREGLVEHRWWTAEELAVTNDVLLPAALPELVREILEFGAPTEPHRIEG